MNKYEKALEDLLNIGVDDAPNQFDLIKELVERATLKKPIVSKGIYGNSHICFKCNSRVFNKWKYCPNCGQTLDWSERE